MLSPLSIIFSADLGVPGGGCDMWGTLILILWSKDGLLDVYSPRLQALDLLRLNKGSLDIFRLEAAVEKPKTTQLLSPNQCLFRIDLGWPCNKPLSLHQWSL